VNLQEVGFRVTGERGAYSSGFCPANDMAAAVNWTGSANAHVAGLTAVDDIRAVFLMMSGAVFADIDLANFRCPGFHAVTAKFGELGGSEVRHVSVR